LFSITLTIIGRSHVAIVGPTAVDRSVGPTINRVNAQLDETGNDTCLYIHTCIHCRKPAHGARFKSFTQVKSFQLNKCW